MRKAETILKDGKFEQAAQMFAEVAAVEDSPMPPMPDYDRLPVW